MGSGWSKELLLAEKKISPRGFPGCPSCLSVSNHRRNSILSQKTISVISQCTVTSKQALFGGTVKGEAEDKRETAQCPTESIGFFKGRERESPSSKLSFIGFPTSLCGAFCLGESPS